MKIYYFAFLSLAFCVFLISACHCSNKEFTTADKALVKDSVNKFMTDIAIGITAKGPSAWLTYFQNDAAFFMADDGKLASPGYDSSRRFITNTLVKTIRKINLKWSDTRIDPLAIGIASVGSNYHEDITIANGATILFNGYFTAVVIQTDEGWKIRSLHWSEFKFSQ